VSEILKTAQNILVNQGIGALSTRRVADEMGISVGNLAYYFSSKDALLEAIIDHVIDQYDTELQQESKDFPGDPTQHLEAFLRYLVEDAKRPEVRAFFYQFWGLSTNHEQIAVAREVMYQHFSTVMRDLLQAVHPTKSDIELDLMTMSMMTLVEGLHVIFGCGDIYGSSSDKFSAHIFQVMLRTAALK